MATKSREIEPRTVQIPKERVPNELLDGRDLPKLGKKSTTKTTAKPKKKNNVALKTILST